MKNEISLDIIKEKIHSSLPPEMMSTKIVSIDGCGGAGKSTFANRLAKNIKNCQVVHTDDFATPENPLNWHKRMLEQVLTPLRSNRPTKFQRYDWNQKKMSEWIVVNPQPIIILEGVSSSRAIFREFLTFCIYIETNEGTRLQRGLERDGDAAYDQWQKWMREENTYVNRDNPKGYSDLVISGNTTDNKIIELG